MKKHRVGRSEQQRTRWVDLMKNKPLFSSLWCAALAAWTTLLKMAVSSYKIKDTIAVEKSDDSPLLTSAAM